MAKYIQVISKIKPKNNQEYKILDLTDVQVNFPTSDYNVLCSNNDSITKSGIKWDLVSNNCTIGGLTNINGNLYIQGSLFQNSDRNLKENIIPIYNALEIINNLDGVAFTWKDTNKVDYGMIAQEVQKIIPQMVSTNQNTGYKQISYIKLIPFLLEAIKQLNKKIEILECKKFHKFSFIHIFKKLCSTFSNRQ